MVLSLKEGTTYNQPFKYASRWNRNLAAISIDVERKAFKIGLTNLTE